MTRLVASAAAVAAGILCGAAQEPPAHPPQRPIHRIYDAGEAHRCARALVGFKNIDVRCTVGATGALEQCEILSRNRRVLAQRRRFECMAAAVTVLHVDDGTPATGRSVQLRLNGISDFQRGAGP